MSMLARYLWCAAPLLLLSGPVLASPMDLRDMRPRWVGVAFEVSPSSKPYQLQNVYTERVQAWFEPISESGQVRITVGGNTVESRLLWDQEPKAGSFSDFVWIFDVATGHVVSASLSGTLWRQLSWGIGRQKVEAKIAADMTSTAVAGYKPPLRLLGNVFHRFCSDPESPRCTLVEGRGYDFESGYVNAVGKMKVGSRIAGAGVFSPLGEAVFSELEDTEPSHASLERGQLERSAPTPGSMIDGIDVAAPPPQIN